MHGFNQLETGSCLGGWKMLTFQPKGGLFSGPMLIYQQGIYRYNPLKVAPPWVSGSLPRDFGQPHLPSNFGHLQRQTWFLLDLITVIPFDVFTLAADGGAMDEFKSHAAQTWDRGHDTWQMEIPELWRFSWENGGVSSKPRLIFWVNCPARD